MPKNLRADIDWHKTRIAFYQQALDELSADRDVPDQLARRRRMDGLKIIIADFQRTLADLERALESLEPPKRP
jgi:hypothetical protein